MENIDAQVMLIVASLFFCGAIIIAIASFRLANQATVKELWQLYAVEFVLVSVVLVPIYFGGLLLLFATIALAWRGQWELFKVHNQPGFGTIQLASYIASGIALFIAFTSDNTSIAAGLILSFIILFSASIRMKNNNQSLPFAYMGLFFPILPLLTLLTLANDSRGFLWLFFIYVIVELNDSLAYLTGKLFGRHHPFPYLSPKKSTEGLIGGLLIATIVGQILGVYLLDLTLITATGAALIILISGLIGDFATSALKRNIGVKDFPPIHGFHGGALDIHDAFLFAIPCFYLYYIWVIT